MENKNADARCRDKSDELPQEESVLISYKVLQCCVKRKLSNACDATTTNTKYMKSDIICNDSNNETKNIADLNDDCLQEIFIYLNIREQFHLAQSCTRLLDVFLIFNNFHRTTLKLLVLKDFNKCELQHFYSLVGQFITRIDGSLLSFHSLHASHIAEHCKTVTHLSLTGKINRRDCFSELIGNKVVKLALSGGHIKDASDKAQQKDKLFKDYDMPFYYQTNFYGMNMREIVELNMFNCGLKDWSIIPLRELQVLKNLDLSLNYFLTGAHINTLSSTIEKLSLAKCKDMKVSNMIDFCASLRNLKELNLIYCFTVFPALDLSAHCKKLEVLKLNKIRHTFLPYVKLQKLKHLGIYGYSHLPNILTELTEHMAMQLESLTIMGKFEANVAQQISQLHAIRKLDFRYNYHLDLQYFCNLINLEEILLWQIDRVDNAALMRLILGCNNLKRVHFKRCALITDELIYDLIKEFRAQIQSNTYKRQEPIIFMVNNTWDYLKKSILNNSEYKASRNILRIDFETISPDFDEMNKDFFGENEEDYNTSESDYDEW